MVTYKNWQMLIDTGPNNKKALIYLENNLPLWDKKIELLIITHGNSDYVGGLSNISKYYKIEQSIYSKNVSHSDLIKTIWMLFVVVNPEDKTENEKDNNKNSIAGILRFWNDNLGR